MNNLEPQQDEEIVRSGRDNSPQIERAITDAQNLVAYTSKAGIEIDREILNTLILARIKWDAGEWSTEFAVKFWEAFTQMNKLIKPVTAASVRARTLKPQHTGFRGFLQNQYGRSEASQAATRFTAWTLAVLFIVLVFQIYWVIGNSLSLKLTQLLDNEVVLADAIDQANLDFSEIEVRFKLAEAESKGSQLGGSYDFISSPDWERETLQVKTERQKLDDELETLKTQIDRNSAILLRWSIGWQWIVLSEPDESCKDANTSKGTTTPKCDEIWTQINDLETQIEKDERLINVDVQKEIDVKVGEREDLQTKLDALEAELVTILDPAQSQDAAVISGANEAGDSLVNAALAQKYEAINQLEAQISELDDWKSQNTVEMLTAQRQTRLDAMKAELAALRREQAREITKEESRKVRVSTDFALVILQSYILPVLYGLLGASVYVIRTITREITNVTYSEESNRDYVLRLALGTLAGLIIGWFVFLLPGQSILGSISPLALSFLVGYNIEIVFSLMDRLIEIFTKSDDDGPTSPTTPGEGSANGKNQTEPAIDNVIDNE